MDQIVSDTLDWLKGRGYEGDDIPKGERWSDQQCPIASAIKSIHNNELDIVWHMGLRPQIRLLGVYIDLPECVVRFICNFDIQLYPQYIR